MFISPALAQEVAATTADATTGGPLGFLVSIAPLLVILLIFYFMVLRPQNKRFAEHRSMISNLRRGDKVVTGGGIIGVVKKVLSDDEVQIEIAEGVQIRVVTGTIMTLRAKADPVESSSEAA